MHCSSSLKIGDIELFWLKGGDFKLDGGTMFGAVPKVLWQKKYPVDADNNIALCNDPLLIKTPQTIILVDTGLGNKLSEKQKNTFQVSGERDLVAQLDALGIARDEVQQVVLSHCDFDHAGGIVTCDHHGVARLTFPKAVHFIQRCEWEDVEHPHLRAKSTYLKENFQFLKDSGQLILVDGEKEISHGVTLRATAGHTRGHQLVEIRSNGQLAVHLGDLFPTHAHSNPLWGMAYDNYPLEVIDRKKELFDRYIPEKSWFTLYHDPFVRACKLDARYRVSEKWTDSQ